MFKLIKNLSFKNLKKKKLRTALMIFLISFLSMSLYLGIIVVTSLQNGLKNYSDRLGADVVIVPYEATTKSTVDDILLTGISGNYYMSSAYYNKIKDYEGIEKISYQFYLTSAKASCCSVRVQIIGFDPETDFSIQPWIQKSYSKEINDNDIVVGCKVNIPEDLKIKFYGNYYNIVAQLAETGTGLDNAVFTNMNTIKQMAASSNALTYNEELQDLDIDNSMSAIFIRTKAGYTPESVAGWINNSNRGIKAQSSASMVSNISGGLGGVSTVIGILLGVVWVLAAVILIVTFILITSERKKEFAILRSLGASRSMLSKIITSESVILSLVSSLIGIFISVLVLIPLSANLQSLISLPFLMPGIGLLVLYAILTVVITVLVCFLSSLKASYDISKNDAGVLLREDA